MTEIQSEIKRLYLAGVQNKSIAILTGLTINQVNRVIYKKLELQSKNDKLTMTEIKEVSQMYRSGKTRREVMERFGIDRFKLHSILRKAG